jgi:hypothetical protein
MRKEIWKQLYHPVLRIMFSIASYCSSFKVLEAGAGAIDAETQFFTDVSDHDTKDFTTVKEILIPRNVRSCAWKATWMIKNG